MILQWLISLSDGSQRWFRGRSRGVAYVRATYFSLKRQRRGHPPVMITDYARDRRKVGRGRRREKAIIV